MRKIIIILILSSVLAFLIYKGNTTVGTTHYEVFSERLPKSFEAYKIVQISDLHDAQFGENHEDVVKITKAAKADAIFITGDFIDSNRYNLKQSLVLIERLQGVAPIYYVTGNHEIATNDVQYIKESLVALDVNVLTDEVLLIDSSEGEKIAIGGIEDPLSSNLEDEEAAEQSLSRAFGLVDEKLFKLLLSHRPEQFDVYAENSVDVTFSGHAHGGQFRIPGVGGLVAPGQGFFPKFTADLHEKSDSQLIISRGLGNSIFPVRIFNQPEVVIVTLRRPL